jgi:hypothetical protein
MIYTIKQWIHDTIISICNNDKTTIDKKTPDKYIPGCPYKLYDNDSNNDSNNNHVESSKWKKWIPNSKICDINYESSNDNKLEEVD